MSIPLKSKIAIDRMAGKYRLIKRIRVESGIRFIGDNIPRVGGSVEFVIIARSTRWNITDGVGKLSGGISDASSERVGIAGLFY